MTVHVKADDPDDWLGQDGLGDLDSLHFQSVQLTGWIMTSLASLAAAMSLGSFSGFDRLMVISGEP